MAVQSTVTRNEYVGNGTTSSFSFTFSVFSSDDIEVIHAVRSVDVDDNVSYSESVLQDAVDYVATLSGSSAHRAWPGSVALTGGALATLDRLVIRRKQALVQSADIKNAQHFIPVSHENVYDKLTMQIQTIQDRVDQCVRIHVTDTGGFDGTIEPGAAENAGRLLVINDSGNGIEFGPIATSLDDAIGAAAAAAASAAEAAASAASAAASAASTASDLIDVQAIYDRTKFEVSVIVTEDTTLAAETAVVRVDPSGVSALEITLPACSATEDTRIIVKNVTAYPVPITLTPVGSDEIDGDSELVIECAYGSAGIVSDGSSEWLVIQ